MNDNPVKQQELLTGIEKMTYVLGSTWYDRVTNLHLIVVGQTPYSIRLATYRESICINPDVCGCGGKLLIPDRPGVRYLPHQLYRLEEN